MRSWETCHKMLKWIGSAVRGPAFVRLWPGEWTPENWRGSGRRIRARHRAYRRAARAGRARNSHRFHRGHQRGRADRRGLLPAGNAREMERQGAHDAFPRFRPLDDFAHGHGLQRYNWNFICSDLLRVTYFHELKIPLGIVATDLVRGEHRSVSRKARSGRRCAPPARIPACFCRWSTTDNIWWMDF